MMTKFKLLATTAVFGAAIMLSSPVMAEGDGWYANMKNSVQNWFSDDKPVDNSADVEAYLDEVTIAVPPMTGENASRIEPAAGNTDADNVDYNEIESFHGNEQTLSTEYDYNSTITAFSDPMTAEEFNNIETAAGDAEEVTDESIVVAEESDVDTDANVEVNADAQAQDDMQESLDDFAAQTQDTADAAADETAETVEEVETATETAIDNSVEETEESVDAMEQSMSETAADSEADADMTIY